MLLRRIPFTAGAVVTMLLVGVISGALFTRVSDHPWGNDIAYGLPSLVDGRVWTLVTGALFAVTPLCYLAVIGSFLVLAGSPSAGSAPPGPSSPASAGTSSASSARLC